jgi:hypothetical protein
MTRDRMAVLVPLFVLLSRATNASAQSAQRSDSAFHAVQRRGGQVMGVDQTTSSHSFDLLPSGARIVLQRDSTDSIGTATIRAHLRKLATSFSAGDFSMPDATHSSIVPGTAVMASRRTLIKYRVHDLPRGGELLMTSRDAAALNAIGEFVRFQRMDHRAGGADSTMSDMHRAHHPKP